MKKIIFSIVYWIIAIAALIAIMLFAASKLSKADSIQGREGGITIKLNTARDSAYVFFYYPDNLLEDSVGCYPWWDSSTATTQLRAQDSPDLDSIGCYDYMVKTYTGNVWTDTLIGQWCNFGSIIVEPGSGYKTYNCNLYVLNSADSTAISGVSVTIKPVGGGKEFVISSTDINGLLVYSSEAESIAVYLNAQSWNFNAVDTLVIAAAQTDSLFGTAFSPSLPPANQTTIFTWILTPAGDTIYPSYLRYRLVQSDGKYYEIDDWVTYGSGSSQIVMDLQQNEIEADSSYMEFSLFANENLSDTLSLYEFYAAYKKDGRPYLTAKRAVAVPDAESFNPFER